MRIPKYRRRVGRDSAFVEVGGKRHRLPGRYGSPESREAYANLLRELAMPPELPPVNGLCVDELAAAFVEFAETYYDRKEQSAFNSCIAPLVDVAGDVTVASFGPLLLAQVQAAMIDLKWCRQQVNRQVNRVRRIFKWGVSKELVPPMILAALQSMPPLRKGKTKAKEAPAVTPAPDAAVDETIRHAPPIVAAMIELQRITGMRSQNLVAIRPDRVDRSKPIWLYRPPQHKSTWRGAELFIFLGPKAQNVLASYMDRDDSLPCFSPREAEKFNPRATAQYSPDTYRQAINYVIDKINADRSDGKKVPHWFPHQLRHSKATAIRAKHGLEGAQVYLGHAHADVTQIYAERDLDLARLIAADMG